MIPDIDFIGFPKISRFNREVIVSEKIDGTNAQIYIDETGEKIFAGSRTRWIKPSDDNFGFAKWVQENKTELLRLGPGSHFGEWWGQGIQRTYGLKEKRFYLFNSKRWAESRPSCCGVVPILWEGLFCDLDTESIIEKLKTTGSVAAPGFMNPEGIVIFHTANGSLFKMTTENDHQPKGR